MIRRLVVHPGFHKTGTTSLQDGLIANRSLLAPHVEVITRAETPAVCRAVAPCPVTVKALRDMTGPPGPMEPVLDLVDLPPGLHGRLDLPVLRKTRGGPKLRARMPKVNRSDLSDRQALFRRRRMLRRWRKLYGRENRRT